MAEILLNKLLNNEINKNEFFEWLFRLNYQSKRFGEISAKYGCSRSDFYTFFLNFIHEEIGSLINEKKPEDEPQPKEKNSLEINKSHSFPLDLSSELDESLTSTPKISKVNSECSLQSYSSLISPIYKTQNNSSTPKNYKKSPICLGDFIINKRVSSKKKSRHSDGGETKRRIKPTNLGPQKVNSFHKSENSFNFNKSDPGELPCGRMSLVEERLKILSRNDLQSVTPKFALLFSDDGEIEPDFKLVSHKAPLDDIIQIYVELLNNNFMLNLTSEVYFLVTLLLKKQFYNADYGISVLKDKVTASQLFNSIHNILYFACKCLESQYRILKNYDKSTIRLLIENERLRAFAPLLIEKLQKITKSDRIVEIEILQDNVCFNSDTDNRQNFPNDPSFHAFRKQRDLFYEILRIWEQHHLSPGFNFTISLAGKIKTLLNLHGEPTNFVHFARLFKAQLLSTCRNGEKNCENFITSLDVDAQKLSKLRSRCVTKDTNHGLNSLPKFSDNEEFYKEFIMVAANHSFNRHLSDALIEEIVELNDMNFDVDDKENDVDLATKKSYYSCVKSLRLLAKFLGFIESLPYKTDCSNYTDHVLSIHLKIRRQVSPSFNVQSILQNSIRRKCVILCVPWLVKYLSMLDHVTLQMPFYIAVHNILFWLYRNFEKAPDYNIYLIKFCLGWFFELPHVPDNNYFNFCAESQCNLDGTIEELSDVGLDQLEIVDQDILYFCCPYLDEIKKLLSSTAATNSVTIKHITPVTALQSPDEIARKKLEQQLEEAFFNGQPISLRKTVEFVSERVASTCVKFICNILVPNHKKLAVEKLRNSITLDENTPTDEQKIALKTKSHQLAAICLKDLQDACDREIGAISAQKIEKAIDSLVSFDILPKTKEVCIEITKRTCIGRVNQWMSSHVTSGIFSKEFNDELHKIINGEVKKGKKPVFMLPPGGNKSNHNDRTTSAAHLLEKIRDLCINVIELQKITHNVVTELLDEIWKSINERGDINQCILATICTQLVDLSILLVAHNSEVMSQDGVMSKFCQIWRLYYNGCDDLFKSLLCPRNVMIFAQSNNTKRTWNAFARFCSYLIKNNVLSCDNFESQCTGIFRTEWDQDTLKYITDFLKTFVGLYRDQGGSGSDFTFLLDFLSDYCEDL